MKERGLGYSQPMQGDQHFPSAGRHWRSSNSSQLDEWLQRLTLQGIQLWSQEGKLCYAGPQQRITPMLLQELKAKKDALLQQLSEPVYAPVSYGQRGLWFIHQQSPENAAYNVSLAYRVCDALDVDLLRDVIQLLVNRHASLRTRFVWRDNELMQQIDGYQAASIETTDAAGWSDAHLLAQIDAFHQRPFDLATGPLLRTAIFQQGAENYSFVLTAHHIVIDGWSVYQLIDELFTFYTTLQQGAIVELPVLQHTYSDYVAWHQSLLANDGERLAGFWQNQLQGELPVLQLPTDYPRPPHQVLRGISQPLQLSSTLTELLKRVARENGCTLYTLLLAAYQLLLHRYSGQEEILVGLSTAGRSRPEFAQIIGYFTAPVVARADFQGNPTFGQFLAQVNQQVWAALDHQDYPFARLVEELNPQRDPSRSPIFQASFVLQRAHRGQALLQSNEAEQSGLATEPIPVTLFEGQHDIALELMERPEGLYGYLKGNAALFATTTLARMAQHLQVLLESIVAESPLGLEQPTAQLPLLTEEEQQRQLHTWNATQTNFPAAQCIHQLFEGQVERTPDAIAVICDLPLVDLEHSKIALEDAFASTDKQPPHERQSSMPHYGHIVNGNHKSQMPLCGHFVSVNHLTYRELNERANQLAHYLQRLGAGPETVVALYVERSADMIIGLLGILKAGAAYLPLDPGLPPERCALLLAEAHAEILLTQEHLAATVPATIRTICLDTAWSTIATESTHNPLCLAVPENLAYVIFTSGSTGTPKGVAVEHRHLLHYVVSIQDALDLPLGTSFATVSTLAADLGNTAIFPTLCTGGQLCIMTQDQLTDPTLFADVVQRHEIACLKITPTHLQALLNGSQSARVLPRELLVLGGEAASWTLIDQIRTLAPQCRIVNHYGPTETTIGVLTHAIKPDAEPLGQASVPIGRPIANTQAYMLDRYLQPVPFGVPGELHIGGVQVTRGYLNRAKETHEKFIPNPFGLGRLYKTGDLCRYLPAPDSGLPIIEFLGRIDDQVKIRGFRVELGEITTHLRQLPNVQDAVVIAQKESAGSGKRLIAYVATATADDTADCWAESNEQLGELLRRQLSSTLPAYMIPSVFVPIKAMALTPNGKIDRRALPKFELYAEDETDAAPATLPLSHTEERLVQIWQEVLGLSKIGIRDNFFDIGGHSILAIQLITTIERVLGINLPVAVLLQHPTIEALGQVLAQKMAEATMDDPHVRDDSWSPLVLINPGDAFPPFFCVHGIAGTVFPFYNLGRALDPAQPFYGLQAVGLEQTVQPHTSVEAMAAAYRSAIQQVQPTGPYLLGGHSFGGEIAFELARQFLQAGEEVALLVLLDSYAPGLHAQAKAQIDALAATTEPQELADGWPEIEAITGQSIRLAAPDLAELSEEKRVQLLATQMQLSPAQTEALLQPSGRQQLEGVLQVLQANVTMRYQPDHPIDVPTVLFRAAENAAPLALVGATLGWERFITSPIDVCESPGDHFRMLAEPHVQTLAAQLMTKLNQADTIGLDEKLLQKSPEREGVAG